MCIRDRFKTMSIASSQRAFYYVTIQGHTGGNGPAFAKSLICTSKDGLGADPPYHCCSNRWAGLCCGLKQVLFLPPNLGSLSQFQKKAPWNQLSSPRASTNAE
eukprot:TRINITY_DN14768_c0_g2_i1.p1 TRINITY_DN14768_c0_g2~~TRINITY_DN14768_c0_g2_i1.p1  ORF type:complete len:103 (+),score=14.85 TRINITY_DN14768_c0_g2_i1:101-409(+)